MIFYKKYKPLLILLGIWAFLTGIAGVGLWHGNLTAAKDLLALRIIDSIEVLRDDERDMEIILKIYEQGALGKCHALAQFLEIKKMEGEEITPELVEEFASLCNLEGYSISDGDGIVRFAIPESFVGYDMKSFPQSQAFLPALTQPDFEFVQSPQLSGQNGKYYQFIGVSRKDEKGIVQIHYNQESYQNVFSVVALQKRIQTMRIGATGCVVVCKDNIIVAAEDSEYIGSPLLEEESIDLLPGEFFTVEIKGKRYLSCYEEFGEFNLVGFLPMTEVRHYFATYMSILVIIMILTFGVILFLFPNARTESVA